jgi:hypothetical protein
MACREPKITPPSGPRAVPRIIAARSSQAQLPALEGIQIFIRMFQSLQGEFLIGPTIRMYNESEVINWNNLVTIGNAAEDGDRGWFVGQFVPPSFGLVHQQALEIKWGRHPKGERRQGFAPPLKATTIAILVNGSLITRLNLPDGMREIILAAPGDYVAFGPGLSHSWEALEDSLVITVRFPSLNNDQT